MKILLHQHIFIIKDDCYEVLNYSPREKLRQGRAYIINDYIYPYRGKYNSVLSTEPGIYSSGKGIKIIEFNDKEKEMYHQRNMKELDPDKMIQDIINNPDDYSDENTAITSANLGDIIQPTLSEDDDFLKRIVKEIILEKRVSKTQCKKKFSKPHEFSNLLQSLGGKTKMTVVNFCRWADLLGFDWVIDVSDPDDKSLYKDIRATNKD